MKTSSLETVLGAIVLIVAVIFLIYSAQMGDAEQTKGYTVNARFNQVGGLQPGDAVRVSGVKIGSVGKITLTTENYLANVAMTIDEGVKLPVDSAASIASTSLLGGTYLDISPGGDEQMLEDQGVLQYTQDAQNIEKLLGQFIFSVSDAKKGAEAGTDAAAAAAPQAFGEAPAEEAPAAEEAAPAKEETAPAPAAEETAPAAEEAKDAAPAADAATAPAL